MSVFYYYYFLNIPHSRSQCVLWNVHLNKHVILIFISSFIFFLLFSRVCIVRVSISALFASLYPCRVIRVSSARVRIVSKSFGKFRRARYKHNPADKIEVDIKVLLWVKTTPGWLKILSNHSGNASPKIMHLHLYKIKVNVSMNLMKQCVMSQRT